QLEEEWEDKVLARVDEYVTVRSEPNADSKALGRMFKGDGGDIIEQVDGWTKIHSGNVEGYVDNEYLVFGTEAYELAQEEVTLVATSLTGGLRIRSEASTEAKILKNVEQGAKLDVVEDTETEGTEWIQVQYAEEKTGYVSAEFVNVQLELGEAMTMEEIEKKEAEEKREKLKQQLASFQANGNEVTLLAALIQAEGGNQPYDGQVAIGAVVMNRVKSGGYPNSIAEVIYAPGQFGVVSNGSIARYLGGPKASCVQAAQEAINGYTTVGSYKHFRRAGADVGPNSIVIGNHVFY
ncbi:MAG: SH3 domain-containing protein, partial [Lachnospiraceae bacterium]|nr:SH3 domain-containing protein [Lachnospiraceae bacterium]